jgi:hypothetical protein
MNVDYVGGYGLCLDLLFLWLFYNWYVGDSP